jgi:hypothetical protein
MPFTVTDFHDLVRLLEEHSDWRTELRRVLLSQDLLDLPRAVQKLAVAQRRTEEAITHLTERMEQGFADATIDRRDMRRDIGQLKGLGQEQFYRDRAAAIFGRLLVQGYDATNQVADHLQEARRLGVISDRECQDVLAADLLWGGQLRGSRQPLVVVLEASWTVGNVDVERAASRAAVLRQAGLKALPVAAGQEWPPNTQDEARRAGVAIVQDGAIDQESWEAALARS